MKKAENIGRNIWVWLRKRSLTRSAFSADTGYPMSTIGKWLDKKKPIPPNAEALLDIADYFGVTIDRLYEDPEEEDEESI